MKAGSDAMAPNGHELVVARSAVRCITNTYGCRGDEHSKRDNENANQGGVLTPARKRTPVK